MGKKKKVKSIRPFQTIVIRKPEPPKEEEGAVVENIAESKAPTEETQTSESVPAVDPTRFKIQEFMKRNHDKTERDVVRMVKAIETERRQTESYSLISIGPGLRTRLLALVEEWLSAGIGASDDFGALLPEYEPDFKGTKPISTIATESEEKLLARFGLTYGVLRRLGVREEQTQECLNVIAGVDLDEALDWLYLRYESVELDERSCPSDPVQPEIPEQVETSATQASLTVSSASLPRILVVDKRALENTIKTAAEETKKTDLLNLKNAVDQPVRSIKDRILAQYGADNSGSDDNSVSEDDSDVNVKHAKIKLRLINLSQRAEKTAEDTESLMARLYECEEDYLFRRADAAAEFKIRYQELQDAALLARLRNLGASGEKTHASSGSSNAKPEPRSRKKIAEGKKREPTSAKSFPSVDVFEEDDSMLGGLLDPPTAQESKATGSLVKHRDMPIPSHWGGRTPKILLKENVNKMDRAASIVYANLSGQSRVTRARVTIRFTGGRTQTYDMTDTGCANLNEAEQYIATIALHSLTFVTSRGFASGGTGSSQTFFRLLPPAFVDLWRELEEARLLSEETINTDIWLQLSDILQSKLGSNPEGATVPKEGRTDKTRVDGPAPRLTPDILHFKHLQADFAERVTRPSYLSMRSQRDTLPIAAYRQRIIESLGYGQVLVLSGETGCGKSTQLPSFILEEHLSRGYACKIICTEPRRISAITLAERVSRELGDAPGAVGTMASHVGFAIRLESNTCRNTKLTFCTTGIALRMLEQGTGPDSKATAFDDVTHIVVDEVHERSIESDFLLIVLKSLIAQRPDLKVILMSATINADKLSAYFGQCTTISVPGRTFPVDTRYLEDAVEYVNWVVSEGSQYAMMSRKSKGQKWSEWNEETTYDEDPDNISNPSQLGQRYSQMTKQTMGMLDQRLIPYELIVRILEKLCFKDPVLHVYSSAILVFMPGMHEIRRLHEAIMEHAAFDEDHFRIFPLHSTISSENQSAAFEIPPPGVRKIIIATNIAETGVTIPDVTCVIDTGKQRETRFDEKRHIQSLTEVFIAKSNAAQRRGRAGRVQEGLCFHLFSKYRHDHIFAEHPDPEILRLSLSDLALRIKILKLDLGGCIEEVLARALDPPVPRNVQRAIQSLIEVKALTPSQDVTPMGLLLSKMPTDVHLAKALLLSVLAKCLDPILTIAAGLSAKSPFVTPFGQEDEADRAKAKFKVDYSDFLTLHAAFASWRKVASGTGSPWKFCRDNYLSHQNLQQMEELRQQLLGYLAESDFIQVDDAFRRELSRAKYNRRRTNFVAVPDQYNVNAENVDVVHSMLGAGLYPRALALDNKAGDVKALSNGQSVYFHPSSVNHLLRRRLESIGTSHMSYFTIMQSSKVFAWETGPLDDFTLLLLCGDAEFKSTSHSVVIDRKVKYRFSPRDTIGLKYLRRQLAVAINASMRNRRMTEQQSKWFALAMEILGALPE